MRLYTLVTPSHEALYQQWLVGSLQDPYTCIAERAPQLCPKSQYKSPGWCATVRQKIGYIRQIISRGEDDVFIFCDADIQCFRPMDAEVHAAIASADLVLQRNTHGCEVCTGFMICRSNPRTLAFWQCVQETMERHPSFGDQDSVNYLLHPWQWRWEQLKHKCRLPLYRRRTGGVHGPTGLRWQYVPDTFWSPRGQLWEPGDTLNPPQDIILHHANWTFGISNKAAQLAYVRSLMTPQ